MHDEDRSLLIRVALIILTGLLVVVIAGHCSRPAHAAQIAGEIEYTDNDDYPALCAGRELDSHGRPVVARICHKCGYPKITATSCTLLFRDGFE